MTTSAPEESRESKRPRIAPRVAPWLSAGLLYLLFMAYVALVVKVIPHLIDLWDESPRLAALGWLGLFTTPIAAVATLHRLTHGALDRFDSQASRGRSRMAEALSAGFFGWFAMMFTNTAAGLVYTIIFPPPPEDSTISALMDTTVSHASLQPSVYTILWIVICAQLYRIERAARKSA